MTTAEHSTERAPDAHPFTRAMVDTAREKWQQAAGEHEDGFHAGIPGEHAGGFHAGIRGEHAGGFEGATSAYDPISFDAAIIPDILPCILPDILPVANANATANANPPDTTENERIESPADTRAPPSAQCASPVSLDSPPQSCTHSQLSQPGPFEQVARVYIF